MAALPLELLAQSSIRFASSLADDPKAPARPCNWAAFDGILPDGGLPHAVVELTCAHQAFAGATCVAVKSVAAALARDARAWCAWIDSDATLFAPGLARAGVDLARLLVVRPAAKSMPRAVVKVATSGAFDVVVVDLPVAGSRSAPRVHLDKWVRKLALAAEQHGTSIVLLTPPHSDPWPVALRLEIARTRDGLDVRVTKDRFGRHALAKTRVPIAEPWRRASGDEQRGS